MGKVQGRLYEMMRKKTGRRGNYRETEEERNPIKGNDTVMVHWSLALGASTPVLNALLLSAVQSDELPGGSQGGAVLVYALH